MDFEKYSESFAQSVVTNAYDSALQAAAIRGVHERNARYRRYNDFSHAHELMAKEPEQEDGIETTTVDSLERTFTGLKDEDTLREIPLEQLAHMEPEQLSAYQMLSRAIADAPKIEKRKPYQFNGILSEKPPKWVGTFNHFVYNDGSMTWCYVDSNGNGFTVQPGDWLVSEMRFNGKKLQYETRIISADKFIRPTSAFDNLVRWVAERVL